MRSHLRSPDETNWSNTTCAPLAKSPNCASHRRQRVRLGERVAVFESEHRLFRQHRVDDLIARLPVADVVERDVARLGLLIDQHRMALRERAALAVLAGEADRKAFVEQRAESERLGGRPVDALAARDRRPPVFEEAQDRLMDVEAVRRRGDALADLPQPVEIDAGLAAAIVVGDVLLGLEPDQRPSSQSALLGK